VNTEEVTEEDINRLHELGFIVGDEMGNQVSNLAVSVLAEPLTVGIVLHR
jgi:hypothetical protein